MKYAIFAAGVLCACVSLILSGSAFSDPAAEAPSATPQLVVPKLITSGTLPPREVFTLRELRQYRAALAPRLIADHMDFPVMVRPSDPIIQKALQFPQCARFGRGFVVQFHRPWCHTEAGPVFDTLKRELGRQKIDLSNLDSQIEIGFCTFLANHDALCSLVRLCTGASEAGRQFMLERLVELRQVAEEILRFKQATLNGLRTLDEIDKTAFPSQVSEATGSLEAFVAASEGMKDEDTRRLLDVQDTRDFAQLSLQRTAELLGKNTTIEEAQDQLRQMSPAEAITVAAYFARSRLQAYADPKQQMQVLAQDEQSDSLDSWLQVGDCRHFAGLAVHFLNHVVKPLNPQLAHWYFGVQTTHIRDYRHAYVKAVQVFSGQSLNVFFFDPTVLASHPLRQLKPDRVRSLIEAASRNDHYFEIKRYAEDFVRSPLDPDVTFDNREIRIDNGEGMVDLRSLLAH